MTFIYLLSARTQYIRNVVLLLALFLLVPFISAGTLYGISTPGGRKLNVFTIDPQVGKATANVTTLYLPKFDATCDKLLLSYENITRELALSCDDNLFFVDIRWNWEVSSVPVSGFSNQRGAVVNIVPSWSNYPDGGNCAFIAYPPITSRNESMGDIACFAYGGIGQYNVIGPYAFFSKVQQFVFSSSSNQIGIFNFIGNNEVMLWGQSLVDNSSNLVNFDRRGISRQAWNLFARLNVPINQLNGATSYSHPLMNNLTVIELNAGVIVLDLTTKVMSNVFSFCQGHAKIGSSAFDPVNAVMYSLVSCFNGPILVTFDIQNRAIKNTVKFDESTLYIKGLFYTL